VTRIEHRRRNLVLWVAGCLTTIALLYGPLRDFWSSAAWGQQSPTQLHSPGRAQVEPRRRPSPVPSRQPPLVEETTPNISPIALPVANTSSALGSSIASCDKAAEGFQPIPLPGVKGEVNLDRCYRGREHLNCSYNALLAEAKSLLQNYGRIVQANYPAVGSVRDICKFTSDTLVKDLHGASEFTSRFRALNAEYNVRISCGSKIAQSLKEVMLPGLNEAPNILNLMSESIRRDMSRISEVEAQIVELDRSIEVSKKAMLLIQKIHRVVCLNHVTPDASLLAAQEHENDRAKDDVTPGFCGYQTVRNENGVWVCRR
jgi:hypothetical protein